MLKKENVKLEIIEEYKKGATFSDIGRKYGIAATSISRFIKGEYYSKWWEANPELYIEIQSLLNIVSDEVTTVVSPKKKGLDRLTVVNSFLNGERNYAALARQHSSTESTVRRFILGDTHASWWEEHGDLRKQVDDALKQFKPNGSPILHRDTLAEIVTIYERSNGTITRAALGEMFGVSPSTIGSFLKRETHRDWWENEYKPIASGKLEDPYANIEHAVANRFILTSAQNNTFVHEKFLKSLEVAADHLGAEIFVGTFSYNRNGFQNLGKGEADWFDERIVKYIRDEPVKLADGLIWCGELNVLPTAVNPLSGFQTYAGGGSGIIPHTKMQMESYPTIDPYEFRFMYTTGAVTQRNYIEKTAGQKASFHHIFGALLVEVDDDGDWFVRQISADTETGEFQDLDTIYTPDGIIENCRVEGINWGDIHADVIDEGAKYASFSDTNPHNMLDVLKPKYQFIHDVFDMGRRNHHNRRDFHHMFELYHKKLDNVEGEVAVTANVLAEMGRDFSQLVVVNSNHDRALQRWLNEACYRSDFTNSVYFLRLQLEVYKAIERGDKDFSIFEYAIKEKLPSEGIDIKFLKLDESFVICGNGTNGIECGMHGDLGANGARGSVGGFRRIGHRLNVGHSHSCRIMDGVYQAGTLSKLKLSYNKGPSSWSHSNIITYPNGKRTIITIKNGKWRLPNNPTE